MNYNYKSLLTRESIEELLKGDIMDVSSVTDLIKPSICLCKTILIPDLNLGKISLLFSIRIVFFCLWLLVL